MIRLAKESDLPAVAAIYEAILDQEDATGVRYTGWQRGAYPTADTARSIFEAGTLYVGADEDGTIWGSMNLNGSQLPEYKNGDWSIPADDGQVAVIHTLTVAPARQARAWPAKWWPLPRIPPAARAKPSCGWTPAWTTPPPIISTPPSATGSPGWWTPFSWATPSAP